MSDHTKMKLRRRDAINRYKSAMEYRDHALEVAKHVAAAWSYGANDYNIYFTGDGSDLSRRIMTFADDEVASARGALYDVFPAE